MWRALVILLTGVWLGLVFMPIAFGEPSIRLDSEREIAFERILLDEVQAMLAKLRDKNVSVIGTLRFKLRLANQSFSTNLGAINLRMAEKTQKALVFANPATLGPSANSFVVIDNAAAIAESIPEADPYSQDPEARASLFHASYPLVWKHRGHFQAPADAFVFGEGEVSDSNRDIRIQLFTILKDRPEIVQGKPFTAPLDPRDIADLGQSYVVSSADSRDPARCEEAMQESARQGRNDPTRLHPLQRPDAPVIIDVQYGTKQRNSGSQAEEIQWESQKPFFLNNQGSPINGAFLPDPKEGKAVRILIHKTSAFENQRLGVIVRVNGESTILKEREADALCSLWVMEANRKSFMIEGFYTALGSAGELLPFEVVNDTTDQALVKRYGKDIGIISLAVYAEDSTAEGSLVDLGSNKKFVAIKFARIPSGAADDVYAMRTKMAKEVSSTSGTLGVIVDSQQSRPSVIPTVAFRPSNRAIFAANIRYYRPLHSVNADPKL